MLALESHRHDWDDIINPPGFALTDSPAFTGTPTAPTPTADNDSTQIANTGWVKDRIDGLGTVFNLKGTKANAASLPTSNNTIGDVWYVTAESVGYIWLKDSTNVERWEKFGEPISLPATYTPSAHSHAWSEITSTPATYTPSAHTHAWVNISNPPSSYTPSAHTHDYAASSHSHAWSAITNPPSSYTPSAHTHAWANISNPPSSYTPSAHNHAWSEITNTPATYTPSTHTHSDLAPINSPQFTGTPTAPSPNTDNNSTAIANTAWVNAAISSALEATDFITAEDLPATYTPSAHTHTWANISNPPASYTPSSHSHSWSEITNQPTIPTASTITPNNLDYTASVGTLPEYAHADHVHQIPRIPIAYVDSVNADADDIYIISDDEDFYPSFVGGQYFYLINSTDIIPHSDCSCYYGTSWDAPFFSDGLPLTQVLAPGAHVLCVMVEGSKSNYISIIGTYETEEVINITLTSETDANDNTVWTISPDYSNIDWSKIRAGVKTALVYYNGDVYMWSGAEMSSRISTWSTRISLLFIKLTPYTSLGISTLIQHNKLALSYLTISTRSADWSNSSTTSGVQIGDNIELLVNGWHDQYTVQDTTLIIGDVPVEENNVSPTPDPGGEK